MSRSLYFDRQLKPITQAEWMRLANDDPKYRVVEQTEVVIGGGKVSTVWLGLDHGFDHGFGGEPRPPIVFESLYFNADGEPGDDQERYASEEEARQGHAKMVARYGGKREYVAVTREGEW